MFARNTPKFGMQNAIYLVSFKKLNIPSADVKVPVCTSCNISYMVYIYFAQLNRQLNHQNGLCGLISICKIIIVAMHFQRFIQLVQSQV